MTICTAEANKIPTTTTTTFRSTYDIFSHHAMHIVFDACSFCRASRQSPARARKIEGKQLIPHILVWRAQNAGAIYLIYRIRDMRAMMLRVAVMTFCDAAQRAN